ncbi:MAG TPA: TMEM175 family protein [Blastocatellia bacterium]|nr:TMEM175 family protein [Blastocatellia bacterium]
MESKEGHTLHFERIVFFSDAVFAIAITLLVLEIKVPQLGHHPSSRDLGFALLGLLPKFVGFVVSFFVIGIAWVEHHRIFKYIANYDHGLMWRNLFFLMAVAFMPFPTALFSEYYTNNLALVVYAVNLALVGTTKLWIWKYASQGHQHLEPTIRAEEVLNISRRSLAMPITCLGIAIAAGFGIPFAYMGFPLMPLIAWLLGRSAKGKAADMAAAA